MNTNHAPTLVLLTSIWLGGAVGQAALHAQEQPDVLKRPNDLKWGSAPQSFPAGAQMAVLSGDPTKSGPYVLRLTVPSNYTIPAHHHSHAENLTVLSGTLHAGMGDKLDKKNAIAVEPGGFAALPANMNHYAWASSPTVIQVHGQGPVDIIYVNPADDPALKK
jgi:quercetin dioxygenase-like cupin family protein